ncbi:hypothetical protein [Vibrio parahaemolyticus]|uniref:hypothetical protein n=2 Tax=Vibrio parahaemolyticus TaxID=670 RepID=UPI00038E546A|nr:hypothetical protein [Vibrio parahaemolyticus]EJG0922063.1 hypothetical protein [Vibrio parahaemolyticus O1:K68]EJG0931609.1 hypothetical protein [Vibrio parahaemolyticus O1]EJG0945890.1 hypothetical protein [Vibrio parahaemolyticus O10]EQM49493.1 hypothetical protein D051_3941 [Vibrio parahaemolyticus VPCR-2010]EGQ8311327.1 hypothetical protein [Vibrio parahaemolyticus]
MMKKYLFVLISIWVLSGCQTIIKANQYAVFDPEAYIFLNTPVVVSTVDEDDLASKFYVRTVVDALKKRGFSSVYSSREAAANNITPRAAVYIRLEEEFDSFTYESPTLGLVDSGYSTTNCSGWGLSTSCSTTNQKVLGVTGYSTISETLVYHSFSLHYYDLDTNKKVLFSLGSTFDQSCSREFLYNFLIYETIARIDFNKPVDYEYRVKLPEGIKCN